MREALLLFVIEQVSRRDRDKEDQTQRALDHVNKCGAALSFNLKGRRACQATLTPSVCFVDQIIRLSELW
jgi:hypothetical protein